MAEAVTRPPCATCHFPLTASVAERRWWCLSCCAMTKMDEATARGYEQAPPLHTLKERPHDTHLEAPRA